MKRAFDIVVSALALLLLSPFIAAAALAIRVTSGSPVFFRQERIGRGYRPFTIYKFRTMVANAPQKGAVITQAGDTRITPVGSLLRKFKLDELPQLVNVLKGDMSIVGPRPEIPRFVNMFHEDFRLVLSVRPGLTDPASLKYRDESVLLAEYSDPIAGYTQKILPDKLTLAKRYVNDSSFVGDMELILKTAKAIFQPLKQTAKAA